MLSDEAFATDHQARSIAEVALAAACVSLPFADPSHGGH